MELEEPITLKDENKGTLCLPDKSEPIKTGSKCDVIGWSHTSYNSTQPSHLMHATVLTVSTSICNLTQAYNGTVNETQTICAGYKLGGIDACN